MKKLTYALIAAFAAVNSINYVEATEATVHSPAELFVEGQRIQVPSLDSLIALENHFRSISPFENGRYYEDSMENRRALSKLIDGLRDFLAEHHDIATENSDKAAREFLRLFRNSGNFSALQWLRSLYQQYQRAEGLVLVADERHPELQQIIAAINPELLTPERRIRIANGLSPDQIAAINQLIESI